MRKKLKQTEGSGIIWAMAVAGFLLLIVGTVLTISYTYHGRSLKNEDARQAYLTARSGVDLIVKEFTGAGPQTDVILQYLEQNGTWTVDDMGFWSEMGACSLQVNLQRPENVSETKRTLIITATAEKNGVCRTVTAAVVGVLHRQGEEVSGDAPSGKLTWYLSAYTDGGGVTT